MAKEVSQDKVDELFVKLKKDGQGSGYYLNADEQFVKDLAKGLLTNESRYGYQSCPCRLSTGKIEKDRDIVCPCDYRDPDLNDYGACYCGLYVNEDIFNGKSKLNSIPERRNLKKEEQKKAEQKKNKKVLEIKTSKIPVWRCRVCGYLCARDNPPLICPICKAKQDRFEQFL